MAAMREIVFDTETTGLDPIGGDRLIEIGCVELYNRIPTGRTFHAYCNPGRPVSQAAVEVHGLDDGFLSDKPPFEAICGDFLGFIGDCPLVAHNAAFDRGFINMEVGRAGHPDHRNGQRAGHGSPWQAAALRTRDRRRGVRA